MAKRQAVTGQVVVGEHPDHGDDDQREDRANETHVCPPLHHGMSGLVWPHRRYSDRSARTTLAGFNASRISFNAMAAFVL